MELLTSTLKENLARMDARKRNEGLTRLSKEGYDVKKYLIEVLYNTPPRELESWGFLRQRNVNQTWADIFVYHLRHTHYVFGRRRGELEFKLWGS